MKYDLTHDGIREFTKKVNSLVISAESEGELHRKLNTLRNNSTTAWQLLRSPVWTAGRLVAVLLCPEKE